jgi:hypothetical protein
MDKQDSIAATFGIPTSSLALFYVSHNYWQHELVVVDSELAGSSPYTNNYE